MTFYSDRVIEKTRKRHRCDWCNQVIEAGSRCVYHAGNWEDFFFGYLHLECAAAISKAKWVQEDGYMQGEQARGRTDDDRQLPPEFTEADYK